MKARETRIKVLIEARMKAGTCWNDVRVLNLSSRGMMLQAPQPPRRGAYVEVRRGRHVIVARVVWSEAQKFGVSTQDRLSIDSLINENFPPVPREAVSGVPIERRAKPRISAEGWEKSRYRGRAMEFACIAFAGATAAVVGFGAVESALAQPLLAINAALAGS